ncbi:MAG: hypothetical protein ISS11_05115, partial [Candidatus Marinimicrobia bacterium]|nr:hypothetical protein [Candidatus Neomarinimicrobiota bacterium]
MNKKLVYYLSAFFGILFLYWLGHCTVFRHGNEAMFIAVLLVSLTMHYYINLAKSGAEIYLRPIAGLKAFEEAVGRATEMGKPVLFIPGISDLDQVETVAGLVVLGHVAGMTAQYEASLNVPVTSAIVMEAGRDACREAYLQSGRPDLYYDDMVHYLTGDQFAYAAGVNGIMLREKPAAVFYQGKFFAESLILAETGNSINAIQVAGTGSPSQIPFFVTACDYTLIGEEFFAASAYLSKKPTFLGSIKGQDIVKFFVMLGMTAFIALFGAKLFEYSKSNEWNNIENTLNQRVESVQEYWTEISPQEKLAILGDSLDWSELKLVQRDKIFQTVKDNAIISVIDTLSKYSALSVKTWQDFSLTQKKMLSDVLSAERNIEIFYYDYGQSQF